MKLELAIGRGLKFNPDGTVGLNISPASPAGDHIKLETDGLYVEAPQGESTGSGKGYDGVYNAEGIRLGYSCPYGTTSESAVYAPGMITCTNIVHKVFDATDDSGRNLIGFRPEIDCTLPGDMYRVDQGDGTYKYFLITNCKAQELPGDCGNRISETVLLGVW